MRMSTRDSLNRKEAEAGIPTAARLDDSASDWVSNQLARCVLTFDSPSLENSGPPVWDLRRSPGEAGVLFSLGSGEEGAAEAVRTAPPGLIDDLIAFGFLVPAGRAGGSPGTERVAVEWRGCRLTVNPQTPLRFEITSARSGRPPGTRMHLLQYGKTALRFLVVGSSAAEPLAEREIRFLKRAGLLVTRAESKSMDGLFAVPVDRELLEFLPSAHRAEITRAAAAPGELMLNRGLIIQEGDRVPARIAAKIYDHDWMQRNLPHLWIEDLPGTAVSSYWLDGDRRQLLEDLVAGRILPPELAFDDLEILCAVQALVPRGYHARREADWRWMLDQAHRDLEADECVVFRNMIAPVQLAMFRRYVRLMVERQYFCHDIQYNTSERYWVPDDPVTSNVLVQTSQLLNLVVPDKVQPGYCLLTSHRHGAELRRHKDQNRMCNYAFSVLIDMIAGPGQEPWPLYSWTTGGRKVKMQMGLGDGGLFRPLNFHGREGKLDHSSALMLFSFVPVGYRGFVNGHRFGR